MVKEDLTSDRINYLIWRYLQESNYRETALKLQSEWNVQDPQQLDFAPHVQNHALVAVLQRGLLFNEAERNSLQARHGLVAPQPGFFGPVAPLLSPRITDEDDYENARKRHGDHEQFPAQNGPHVKRPRLSNGYENGVDPLPMEVDESANGNGHAYPSPKEVEEPPTPIVTNGPAAVTQIEKVPELSADTIHIPFSEGPNGKLPTVLYADWSPRDPTILAAAGSDALARLWTISRGDTGETTESHVNGIEPPFVPIISEPKAGTNPTISAIAWTPDGAFIAVATYFGEEEKSKISLWTHEGVLAQEYADVEPPVMRLRWNPTNTLLLALVADGEAVAIAVYSTSGAQSITHTLPPHIQPIDATWTGEFEFLICSSDTLIAFRCGDSGIYNFRKFETREEPEFNSVTFDWRTKLVATGSETGIIDIWDQNGERNDIMAHQGPITSLIWQPLTAFGALDEHAERLLASAGEDGVISIWNARGDLKKPKCSMTMDSAIVGLSFTPDGAFLAGATTTQILIWRVEDPTNPRARWSRGSDPGWQSPKLNGTSPEEDQHSLCWDADGQKLAYGVNSQLVVIKWHPSASSSSQG